MRTPTVPVTRLAPHSRALGLVGLLTLAVIGLALVRGQLTIDEAGLRAGVALGALLLTDRVLVPVAALLVGPPRPDPEDEAAAEDAA